MCRNRNMDDQERRYDDLDIMKTQKGDSMYQILSPVTDY
jgi:hypothetical protein